eukprot:CAMPEP_0197032452 /NCGR_PEP_ID=MMETSP1384-20130603/11124_1 /TAXON_ID=29189 /ORGANISM="Ammonia sp." /LENGTH=296 /DNA_ID=CAMNT_0042462113 /DNA_START=16 /DNA_END=906 /DNA_ORIENTATION=+
MAQPLTGSIFGALIAEIESPSFKSKAYHNNTTNHMTKSTDARCPCGAKLLKASYESVFGSNYEHHCNRCDQWIGGHPFVFHCYSTSHDLWHRSYSHGYTLCNACVHQTSAKLPTRHNRPKPSQIEQENNKLLSEIEHKLQMKQQAHKTKANLAQCTKTNSIRSTSISSDISSASQRAKTENAEFMAMFKNGWMYKRGGYHTAWKERYFELNGVFKTLTYYVANAKCTGCKYIMHGFIDFKQTPILKMMKSKKEDEFHVVTTKREWVFKCKDMTQRNEWYDAIKTLCAMRKRTTKSE